MKLKGNADRNADIAAGTLSILSISPDKTHILIVRDDGIYVINLAEQKVEAKLEPFPRKTSALPPSILRPQFITNKLIYVGGWDEDGLYDLDGRWLGSLNFFVQSYPIFDTLVFFSPDLRHGLVCGGGGRFSMSIPPPFATISTV